MKKIVKIQTTFEATHCWPDCNIESVSYLKNQHRHLFFVAVAFLVTQDRQIEFIDMKRQIDGFILMNYKGMFIGSKSCETIAEEIYLHFQEKKYPIFSVSISEDNENGVEVWL
jgi:hypothetical protein